jgi:hypothetical protein
MKSLKLRHVKAPYCWPWHTHPSSNLCFELRNLQSLHHSSSKYLQKLDLWPNIKHARNSSICRTWKPRSRFFSVFPIQHTHKKKHGDVYRKWMILSRTFQLLRVPKPIMWRKSVERHLQKDWIFVPWSGQPWVRINHWGNDFQWFWTILHIYICI